jgi:hypothetical protein
MRNGSRAASREGRSKRVGGIAAAAAFVCLFWSGCIQFERQLLTYRHDPSSDTLRVYQTYVGVFGDGTAEGTLLSGASSSGSPVRHGEGLNPDEQNQLLDAFAGQQTYTYTSWPSLDFAEVRAEKAGLPPEAVQVLLAGLHVSNGPFYLDAEGRLCAVQRITVTHISKVLAAFEAVVRSDFAKDRGSRSAEQYALELRVAANPEPLVWLEGNRVTLRRPQLRENFESDDYDSLVHAGVEIAFADDTATFRFGRTDSDHELFAVLPDPGATYVGNAVAFVRERFGIAERFDAQADAARFFGSRAATAPR